MGLQYGVLLRPEIMKALETYGKILRWEAKIVSINQDGTYLPNTPGVRIR